MPNRRNAALAGLFLALFTTPAAAQIRDRSEQDDDSGDRMRRFMEERRGEESGDRDDEPRERVRFGGPGFDRGGEFGGGEREGDGFRSFRPGGFGPGGFVRGAFGGGRSGDRSFGRGDSAGSGGFGRGSFGGPSFGSPPFGGGFGGGLGGSPFGGGAPFGGPGRGDSGGDRSYGSRGGWSGEGRDRERSSGSTSDNSGKSTETTKRGRVTLSLPDSYAAGDRDRDGQIGLYEWRQWKPREQWPEFTRLDRNSDGFLTPRELVRSGTSVASGARSRSLSGPAPAASATATARNSSGGDSRVASRSR